MKLKRLLVLLCVLVLSVTFVACTKKEEDKIKTEVALITDIGDIDDQSFNQSCWEAVKEYAVKNSLKYNYYKPAENTTEARETKMKAAIEDGASILVLPGYLFEDAVYDLQTQYPSVEFLLIDGEPHTADYKTYKTEANTSCIIFKEEQAGYFAGYAAVMDGYRQLGFCGGVNVPAVIRYGYGYVQGAEAAATELKLAAGTVKMNYWYSGTFSASDDIKTKMDGWYGAGTEIVFSCGGSIYNSVVAAAEEASKKVIGVDVDQAHISDCILTSAEKYLKESVKKALTVYYGNSKAWLATGDANAIGLAGKTANVGAADDCVGLPTATTSWRFATYKIADYESLYKKVADGTITISNACDDAVKPTTTLVTVSYQ